MKLCFNRIFLEMFFMLLLMGNLWLRNYSLTNRWLNLFEVSILVNLYCCVKISV